MNKKNISVILILLCLLGVSYIKDAISQTNIEKTPQVEYNQKLEEMYSIALDGSPEELKQLINTGIDVNQVHACGTLLNVSIRSMVKGKMAINFPEYSIEKVKFLISAGVDVNQNTCSNKSGRAGMTPLAWAIMLPLQIQETEKDVNKAVDEEIKRGQEHCDIPGIASKPCKDITMSEREAIRDAFHEDFKNANKELVPYYMSMIELLVDNGANINGVSGINIKGGSGTNINGGNTSPLHYAALIPQDITLKPLKYLISKGANLNVQDINGNTPLFYAVSIGNNEAVKLLIDAGADTAIRNNVGGVYSQVSGGIIEAISMDENNELHTEIQNIIK